MVRGTLYRIANGKPTICAGGPFHVGPPCGEVAGFLRSRALFQPLDVLFRGCVVLCCKLPARCRRLRKHLDGHVLDTERAKGAELGLGTRRGMDPGPCGVVEDPGHPVPRGIRMLGVVQRLTT